MGHKSDPSEFIVDLHIRFRGKIYNLRLASILRWLLPLLVVAARFFTHLREDGH